MTVPTNRYKHMALACKVCGHRPAPDSVVEATLLHFQVDHDTDQIELNLVAVCDCGASMEQTDSRPTGGGFKDYLPAQHAAPRATSIAAQVRPRRPPGRFAWLLADVQPLDEPIPARGRQGLWNWDEAA